MRLLTSVAMFLAGATLLASSALGSLAARDEAFRISWRFGVDYIDPALANQPRSWTLEYATGALLLNYPDAPIPKGSRLVPEVAAGFPAVSADGKTYTFRLRATYRFSNGRPVRALHFVRAFDRARDPRVSSPGQTLVSDVLSVRALGRHTLRIRTVGRSPDLLARLATPFFMAVPADLPVDPEGVGAPLHSAGPYYVREWAADRRVVLERNRFYRGPRPHNVNRIHVELTGLPALVKEDIDRGATDTGEIPIVAHAELGRRYGVKRRSPGRYFVNPQPTIVYFALNTERDLFRGNVRLRQAVNFAIDRRAMSLQYGPYGASVHDQLLPPGMPGFVDFKLYPRRSNLARALALAEGRLRSGKARLWCPWRPPSIQLCHLVQSRLRDIGLQVDVRPDEPRCPEPVCDPTQRGMAWDIALWSRRARHLDPYEFMRAVDGATIGPSENTNLSYFRHPGFDRRIARANRLFGDPRYRAFSTIDRDVMRQAAPVAVIAVLNDRHYVSARTGCFHDHPVYGLDLPAICIRR
jgi:peptide/nickel transport system substrate-binding protein